MRITQITNNLSFQKLPIRKNEDFNLIDKIDDHTLNPEDSNKYSIYTTLDNQKLTIDINDKNRRGLYDWHPIATSSSITKPQMIYVNWLGTTYSYQKKGLGTVLHLLNIVEMLENNKNSLQLDAIPSSITYHAKMKFKTKSNWNKGLENNLKAIAEFDPKYKEKINELINTEMPSNTKAKIGCKYIDEFIEEGLKKYPEKKLKWVLRHDMDMVLTKEQVIKDREFYNNLFKKYNIDYEISPEDV